jgi:FkbM family methyltransferase
MPFGHESGGDVLKLPRNGEEFGAALNAVLAASGPSADAFFSQASEGKRYVIGRNDFSAELAGLVRVAGLIDDYAAPGTRWKDIPVVAMKDIPRDAHVANCSGSISPVDVEDKLRALGVNVHGTPALVLAAAGRLSWPWFVRQQRDDWSAHAAEWKAIYEAMADEGSRKTLFDVARYRLTADSAFMRGYSVRLRDQYFEDFAPLRDDVFVDAGGFDGDTTEEFCLRGPSYRKVHLFEPSQRNIAAARARLARFPNIQFHEVGISDVEGVLHFNPDAGSASAVTDGGGESIRVTTLDSAIAEPVTFIKMDLEGWEMKALAGSVRHIREEKPKLAIAVYHSASDFRDVFRFALSLCPDYKVHLRHYTQGWSETVMYFV